MVGERAGWAVSLSYPGNTLLRTTDGGIHWKDITPVGSSGQRRRIRTVHILTSRIAWVGWFDPDAPDPTRVGSSHTVDGGQTWKQGSIPTREQNPALGIPSIHFINPRDGWLLATGSAAMGSLEAFVYRSTDGGANWIEVATDEYQSQGSGLPFGGTKSGITFLSATTGWITGGHGIAPNWLFLYMTRDAGRTWRQQKLALPPEATSSWSSWTRPPKFFTSRNGILPVSFEFESRLGLVLVFYVTHDGGTTWAPTKPLSVARWHGPLWEIPYAFTDMDNGWVSDGDALYTTSDGGRHWKAIQPTQPFADVKQLDFVSTRVGFAISKISPYFQRTLDGGRTWTPVTYTISR